MPAVGSNPPGNHCIGFNYNSEQENFLAAMAVFLSGLYNRSSLLPARAQLQSPCKPSGSSVKTKVRYGKIAEGLLTANTALQNRSYGSSVCYHLNSAFAIKVFIATLPLFLVNGVFKT
jgi:hypothetical protein